MRELIHFGILEAKDAPLRELGLLNRAVEFLVKELVIGAVCNRHFQALADALGELGIAFSDEKVIRKGIVEGEGLFYGQIRQAGTVLLEFNERLVQAAREIVQSGVPSAW